MDLRFAPSEFLTLGAEIEVQLVDPYSLDLVPAAPRLLSVLRHDPRFKPEIFSTMLEFCTSPCPDMATVEAELQSAAERLNQVAEGENIRILAAGTHPFAGPGRQEDVYPSERYRQISEHNGMLGSRANVFGLHVHVGVTGPDHAVALINGVSPYLPHLLALSASSPFCDGYDSGLCSSRVTFFEAKPNCGPAPQFATWSEFEHLVQRMVRSGSIRSLRDVHWDIRPCPHYGTVEVRICDGQPRLADACVLVALTQWLFAWIDQRLQAGEYFAPLCSWRLRENKWRALRWGLEAEILVDDFGNVNSLRREWLTLLFTLKPIARQLGGLNYLEQARAMLDAPSYVRQRSLVRRTGCLQTLTRALADEWRQQPPMPKPRPPLLALRDRTPSTHIWTRMRRVEPA